MNLSLDPALAHRALAVISIIVLCASLLAAPSTTRAQTFPNPFHYTFNAPGTLFEAATAAGSPSPYFWLKRGGKLVIESGRGKTIQGDLPAGDPIHDAYAASATVQSDGGAHPQNSFLLLSKISSKDTSVSAYFDRTKDNLKSTFNQHPYNGQSVLARYQDDRTFYIATMRADGYVVIKKKVNGTYTTLAAKKVLPGVYSASNLNVIPLNRWIGLRLDVADSASGVSLSLYTDYAWTGTWTPVLSATDTATPIVSAGVQGLQSDYADVIFDSFDVRMLDAAPAAEAVATPTPTTASTSYDSVVLADAPVLYLPMNAPASGAERDLAGSHTTAYKGGTPTTIAMPNGDNAARFSGSGQYLAVSSAPDLSISHTGALTWEGWVRADTLTFPKATASGYVDWMGKCENYSPNCEWEARLYSTQTQENRPSRFSAYVFNPTAGLGSGSDWQPAAGQIVAGQWVHVVAEYQTKTTPAECPSGTPGTINIWIDGVKQSFADHVPTGCMSQFQVSPKAGNSPLNIGTMAFDSWFPGAVGKVAVYDHLLTQSQIDAHFAAMTGTPPAGSCGATCTLSSAVTALLSQTF